MISTRAETLKLPIRALTPPVGGLAHALGRRLQRVLLLAADAEAYW